jgi:hypothetical protein
MRRLVERFATGAWLDRSAIRATSVMMIAGAVLAIGYFLETRHGTLDIMGRPIGTDFSNVWTAGRMALEGRAADAYNWALHYQVQQAAHGSESVPFYGWHYPPFFLLVAAALATLPYLPALAVWQASTMATALALAWRIRPAAGTLLAALGFPAVLVCLGHGHNGFLTAALFGGGLFVLDRRPVLGGVLLGCLAYKPHFGLVIPLALVAGGYWRALASAAAAVLALALASLASFGPEVFGAFLGSAHLTQAIVLEQGAAGWFKIQSVFAWLRMWGGPVGLAYAAQGIATAGIVAATTWLWWVRADSRLKSAALMIGALLATPYVLDYDMVLLGPAIALLVVHGEERGFRRWEKTALALAWFMPVAARILALLTGVPGGLAGMALLFILVVRRALAEPREGSATEPLPAIA